MDQSPDQKRQSLACALLAVVLALAWLFLDVRYNYRGNWTGLFCIGDETTLPASLAGRNLYRFPQSKGYDGQFYYFIAHDPFLQGDTKNHLDNPPLRWRRILLPALSYLAALGRVDLITAAYVGMVLAAVGAGAWWLSRFCQSARYGAFWGLCFLAVPGVAVSLDRMTVDVLLAALSVAFAVYSVAEVSWKIYPILLLAPLVRETGLALILAFCLFSLVHRQFQQAALGAAMACPWAAWALFVRLKLWPDGTPWTSGIPLAGLVARTLDPVQFAITGRWFVLAALLDYVALLGVWLAFSSWR